MLHDCMLQRAMSEGGVRPLQLESSTGVRDSMSKHTTDRYCSPPPHDTEHVLYTPSPHVLRDDGVDDGDNVAERDWDASELGDNEILLQQVNTKHASQCRSSAHSVGTSVRTWT